MPERKKPGAPDQPVNFKPHSGINQPQSQHPREKNPFGFSTPAEGLCALFWRPRASRSLTPEQRSFIELFTSTEEQSRHPDNLLSQNRRNQAPPAEPRLNRATLTNPASPVTYETAVEDARAFLQEKKLQTEDPSIPPQAIIQNELARLGQTNISGPELARRWNRIGLAWDILTHHTYDTGSRWERNAGLRIQMAHDFQNPVKLFHDETLTIGGLLEAAGVTHEGGISVLPIPQHLKHYDQWTLTDEYRDRLLNPKSKQNNRG